METFIRAFILINYIKNEDFTLNFFVRVVFYGIRGDFSYCKVNINVTYSQLERQNMWNLNFTF